MKTRKRTGFGSFSINMDMYNEEDARNMLDENDDIFYINDEFNIECTSENYHFEELRINHSACEEVKVVYNEEYEEYENVVKTKDGAIYYVQL